MSVEWYAGVPGVAIEIESVADLVEGLDALHSQVLDALGEGHGAARMVSKLIDDLYAAFPDEAERG